MVVMVAGERKLSRQRGTLQTETETLDERRRRI